MCQLTRQSNTAPEMTPSPLPRRQIHCEKLFSAKFRVVIWIWMLKKYPFQILHLDPRSLPPVPAVKVIEPVACVRKSVIQHSCGWELGWLKITLLRILSKNESFMRQQRPSSVHTQTDVFEKKMLPLLVMREVNIPVYGLTSTKVSTLRCFLWSHSCQKSQRQGRYSEAK